MARLPCTKPGATTHLCEIFFAPLSAALRCPHHSSTCPASLVCPLCACWLILPMRLRKKQRGTAMSCHLATGPSLNLYLWSLEVQRKDHACTLAWPAGWLFLFCKQPGTSVCMVDAIFVLEISTDPKKTTCKNPFSIIQAPLESFRRDLYCFFLFVSMFSWCWEI